jgi:MinD-like ATPase involved in chromosome partitioning or flagellar assembly
VVPTEQEQPVARPVVPKPPKAPLSERLPPGVYENRPRYKRFVLHWLYFWAWARLGLYKTKLPMPRPAVREQIRRNFDEIRKLAETRQPIIACVNSKGGSGKSAMSTWLAALIWHATKRAVVAADANENKGSTAARFGVDREKTLQLRTFLRYEKELSTAAAINDALAQHPGSGVLVLASEAADKTIFSQRLFERRMRTLHTACHTLVLDAGNGIPHNANRGSVAIADVLIFPATIKQPDSFEDAHDTRRRYASTDAHYGFGDKVEQGIVPLLGVSEKQRLEYIERFDWNPDKVFRVPEDPFMVGEHIVDWFRLRPRTQLALTEVAKAIFQTAPVVTPWNAQVDDEQNKNELDLTEVRYIAP